MPSAAVVDPTGAHRVFVDEFVLTQQTGTDQRGPPDADAERLRCSGFPTEVGNTSPCSPAGYLAWYSRTMGKSHAGSGTIRRPAALLEYALNVV
jgi:hypothetical protein